VAVNSFVKIFGLFFLVAFAIGTFGQDEIYASAKKLGSLELNELISWATENYNSDEEVCKFFYYWTATHIQYDRVKANTGPDFLSWESCLPQHVMESKRAVCSGYARLYHEFLSQCGIQSVVINGISKTQENILKSIPYMEDHAWNAVKIGGSWFLTDVTWANTTSRDGFIDEFYFMTPPRIFIFDHFPTDPGWQLLDNPISYKDFEAYPCYTKKYFQLGFGVHTGDMPVKQPDGRYRLKIGLSMGWTPVPIAVNNNNQEFPELRYKVTTYPKDRYQTISFTTRKKIIRIDAVRTEKNYTFTELGIAYFDLSVQ
jgi:hypothetical protein